MSQLVIEYVFEGHRRGYDFTSRTRGYDEATLHTIWRCAMPRGQGWGSYQGARALKVFALPEDHLGISEVTVTDLRDEGGRGGIRRAVVDVIAQADLPNTLQTRWLAYPSHVTQAVREKHAALLKTMPRLKRGRPLVFSAAYTTAPDWWVVEATLVRLMLDPPRSFRKWESPLPFTTLALDTRRESPILAMPADHAAALTDAQVVPL